MKFSIRTVQSVDSTQDIVKEAAIKNEAEGFVIHAAEQRKGRGRHGNSWYSPQGNLYMSVLLRPECLADDATQISFVSALAVSAALDNYISPDKEKFLKWPNDILVGGKKICGILAESTLVNGRVDSIALGIGLNVSAPLEGTICLNEVNGRENSIEGLRDSILAELARQYKLWKVRGFDPIRKSWIRQAYGMEKPITVCLPDSEINGIFKAIDEQGWLVIQDKSGNERHIKSGQINFK